MPKKKIGDCQYYIYKIVCTANNREYIGLTRNFNHRVAQHISNLYSRSYFCNTQLFIDFHKYGADKLSFSVIETFIGNIDDAMAKEAEYILKAYKAYNIKNNPKAKKPHHQMNYEIAQKILSNSVNNLTPKTR